jgi:hypothetical protein
LSQNKNVLVAYPELQNKNLGAGFMPRGGPDGLAALGLGVTALAGGGLQLGLGGGGAGLVAAANPWVLAALVLAAGAFMVLGSDVGQDAIRNIEGVLRASGTSAKIGAKGQVQVEQVTITGTPDPNDPCKGRTEPTLPDSKIADQGGIRIAHYYRGNDHGPAHFHVSGGGPTVRVGPNGKPLAGEPELTPQQRSVVQNNLSQLRNAGRKIGRWLDYQAKCK